ncbi:MAG: hypothetical protein E7642_01875 [Ruminococcaceae bacterium]|nr:hypothetical protein [Oscillospiraceae bacterium]
MNDHKSHYIKNLLLPCLVFSVATGVFSAVFITAFKWIAEEVIRLSSQIYDTVRAYPVWLPCLLIGTAAIGLISSLILSLCPTCRGGGIPTTITAIKGVTDIKWLSSAFVLPISAFLTFLCGIPLGTEGPCVQMGSAVGDGTVRILGGKKNVGWRRYIMTGGACAGFSLATGAPISAILFSMEELHKRFSPLLFSVASISVISGQITARLLSKLGIGTLGLFHVSLSPSLPYAMIFIPITVGILCGACALLFSHLYRRFDKLMSVKLSKISIKIKFPLIFACVALVGFFFSRTLGSGHELIDHMLGEYLYDTHTLWYVFAIVFLIRAIFMMIANTAGVTGGIFLPTLAFGAIIGALCAEAFIAMGAVGSEYYVLIVVIGMTAFLGASSRIPLTACVFAIEALSGINNIISIIVAIVSAFLIVELSGLDDFTEEVVKAKTHAIHEGKEPYVIEVPLTVYKNSFVIDKELRDILWPASCVVLSIERGPDHRDKHTIAEGDILTVHYKTYDPIATAEEFEVLVGDQNEEIDRIMRPL